MKLERYRNLNGDSGIDSFEVGTDFIVVKFKTGATYIYNYEKPGRQKTEEIKRRALAGRGVSTYISQEVREDFARKLD